MKLAWGAKVSAPFRQRAIAIATAIACDPSGFMSCIAFETGETFSPTVTNPKSSAIGLIQFMTGQDSWAVEHGYTKERLAAMTGVEQLDVVAEYFRPYVGRLHTLSDLYMAILWPKAVGLAEDAVIFPAGSRAYLVNRGLDLNHDNQVTKAEAAALVAAKLTKGMLSGNVYVEDLAANPPANIPGNIPTPAPASSTSPPKEPRMGALAALLPTVFQLFAGRAAASVQKLSGAPPEIASQFITDMGAKLVDLSGMKVTDDVSALKAVAAVVDDPAKMQALQDHALDYFEKVAPLLDKLAAHELAMARQADDSADRAAARGQKDRVDFGPQLARWAMWVFAMTAVVLGVVMTVQVYTDASHKVDGVLIGLLTILVYAAARIAESPFRYRFGGNADSQVLDSGNAAVRSAIPNSGAKQ